MGEKIMATNQVTITNKQINKGAKGILDLTGKLPQVLKQFEGLYKTVLPECDGMTVEEWMDAMGVHRWVGKNGAKKGYTPAALDEGWCESMKKYGDDGKVVENCIFRNVRGQYIVGELGSDDYKAYHVYTKEEAFKENPKPIVRYMLKGINRDRWTMRNILDGLKQTYYYDKHNKKSIDSDAAWANVEEVYILKKVVRTDKDGNKRVFTEPKQINRSKVLFV